MPIAGDFFVKYGVDASAVSIPAWLDLLAVVVGALSGILVAQDRKLDAVGHIGLALIGGLGGGLIRDLIMQVGDVYMLRSRYAIWSTVIVGILGFLFPGVLKRHPSLLEWSDIMQVGLFVAAGTDKAIVYSLAPEACVLMGILTGVGGGMIRDVFLGQVPRIFKRDNYYAICALAGAVTYYICVFNIHFYREWAAVFCVLVTIVLRRLSLRFNLLSPAEVDLTPKVADAGRSVYRRAVHRGEREAQELEGRSYGARPRRHHTLRK